MEYNLKDVTIGIKTFNRPEKLRETLDSLVGVPVKEIIVADDGKRTKESQRLYKEMEKKIPLRILELPYDSGLAKARNEIVDACVTPYILIIDDDMKILSAYHIWILKDILVHRRDLGGVSSVLIENGTIKSGAHNLKIEKKYLIKYVPKNVKIKPIGGHPVVFADLIPNSTLFRRKVLLDNPWDEHYKIGYEHVDFYLSQKQLGKWKFVLSLSSFIIHNPGGSTRYKEIRFNKERLKMSRTYFLKKWKLKGIIIKNVEVLSRISCKTGSCLWTPIRERLPLKILILTSKIEENLGRILRIKYTT